VSDRIVLRATYDVIEPLIRDRVANPCSYGYVKGRSIEDAAEHLLRSVGAGRDWVLESDICGFFDEVDRALLKDKLRKLFGSDRMLFSLLEQAVDVSLGDTSHLEPEQAAAFPACGCGIPQGGGLSPLFANVYLLVLDEGLRREGFDMVRWADDFVVLCASEDEAWKAFAAAEQVLGTVRLRLHSPDVENGKTRVVRYFRGFDFLGLRFGKDGVVPCREKVNEWRKRVGNICKEARSVLGMLTELKRFVQGWLGAYRACRGPRCESLWAALNDELAAAVAKHSNRLGVSIVEADGSTRFLTRMGLPVCGA
jgi:RNA-directed DNA polymerase